MSSSGTLTSVSGDLAEASHTAGTGIYTISDSGDDVTACALFGTPNSATASTLTAQATSSNTIVVHTYNGGVATDEPFSLMVSC